MTYITIKKDKKTPLGILLGLLTFILCGYFFSWVVAIALSGLFFALSVVRLDEKINIYLLLAFLLLSLTIGTSFVSQILTGPIYLWNLPLINNLIQGLIIITLISFFFTMTQHVKISIFTSSLFVTLLSVADYYIYRFRGTELNPTDFLSIKTAMNVSGTYNFFVDDKYLYYGIIIFFICMYFLYIYPKIDIKTNHLRFKSLIVTLLCTMMCYGCCYQREIKYWENNGSLLNGYLVNFTCQTIETLKDKTPEGYSLTTIQALEDQYASTKTNKNTPNIIAIMNESYADLSVLGNDLKISEDLTPFYDSLNKNIVKGYALTSVYGGGTSNSEYEFLTGNSIGFVSAGASVYQLYLKNPSYSIASYLKSLGYTTFATHPYHASGWSRTRVYPLLGFDGYSFLEDYPQQQMIRNYVSDQEAYEYIIDQFENKEDNPLFLFSITMQNHSSYMYPGEGYEDVDLSNYSQHYQDASQYLGLLRESDKALKYLIEYFENVKEDTVILFFGDHFPALNQSFYEEIHGGPFDTLDKQQLQYTVPFFIWANYDIEEKNVELTSLNYLSNYLYEVAGIELPSYQQFLSDVKDVIPAINSKGYYSLSEQQFITFDQAQGNEAKLLQKYQMLQHNALYDIDNQSNIFFPH